MSAKSYRCGCGEWTGEACEWCGPLSKMVVVEYMPESLRGSHAAANNSGSYPHNGSVRVAVERECAERLVEGEGEWAYITKLLPADYVEEDDNRREETMRDRNNVMDGDMRFYLGESHGGRGATVQMHGVTMPDFLAMCEKVAGEELSGVWAEGELLRSWEAGASADATVVRMRHSAARRAADRNC